jgi:hypothetical protein
MKRWQGLAGHAQGKNARPDHGAAGPVAGQDRAGAHRQAGGIGHAALGQDPWPRGTERTGRGGCRVGVCPRGRGHDPQNQDKTL